MTESFKPRRPSSTRWTAFPGEYIEQISQAFAEAFPELSKTAHFVVEGRIYPEEILLRVGFIEKGRLKQNNFEVSCDYSPLKEKNILNPIHHCIDLGASLMQEFVTSEDPESLDLPRQWQSYEFEGVKMWIQYNTVNTDLEQEADRLLGLAKSEEESALLQEDEETEEVDLREPSLFSGQKRKSKKDHLH